MAACGRCRALLAAAAVTVMLLTTAVEASVQPTAARASGPSAAGSTTVGVVDPATVTWYLRNTNGPGPPDVTPFAFGVPGWIPVAGDWNGDGTTTIGAVDPTTMTWYLRNTNGPGPPDVLPFAFGAPGWIPVAGDWNGDGTTTIGAVDPTTMTWYLRNTNGPGPPDVTPFAFGVPGWIPVAGDWNGTDTTPPTTTDDAPSGWLDRPVVVHLTASDDDSGVAATYFSIDGGVPQQGTQVSIPAPSDHSNDGIHTISYHSVDNAGNDEQPHSAAVRIDTTPPVVGFAGNAGSYTVDQTVSITCSAADALSGIASTTCTDTNAPAWSFGLGTTTLSATATDGAGNSAGAATSFSVTLTVAGLDGVIVEFFGGDADGAHGLIAKADSIASAPNEQAKNGKRRAFDNAVEAKTGKPLSPAQASLLEQLAAAL